MSDYIKWEICSPKKKVRVSVANIHEAINLVIYEKYSIRAAARKFNIGKSHLTRLVKQARECESFVYEPKIGNKKVFTTEQETFLGNCLENADKLVYGLYSVEIRQLAYNYAIYLNIAPPTWEKAQQASLDWLKGFKRRNPSTQINSKSILLKTEGSNVYQMCSQVENRQPLMDSLLEMMKESPEYFLLFQ